MKHLPLLIISCAVVFHCAIPVGALGQGSMSNDQFSARVSGKGKGFRAVKHTFTGGDGGLPTAVLIQDSAGNLYGTTSSGGDSGLGVVFKLDTGDTETVFALLYWVRWRSSSRRFGAG